jgi:hypothetical protein
MKNQVKLKINQEKSLTFSNEGFLILDSNISFTLKNIKVSSDPMTNLIDTNFHAEGKK